MTDDVNDCTSLSGHLKTFEKKLIYNMTHGSFNLREYQPKIYNQLDQYFLKFNLGT